MSSNAWTVERVKEELPEVKVLIGKKTVVDGAVRGRKMPFAGVMFSNNGVFVTAEYAWQTIVDCLNDGRPLRY